MFHCSDVGSVAFYLAVHRLRNDIQRKVFNYDTREKGFWDVQLNVICIEIEKRNSKLKKALQRKSIHGREKHTEKF